MLNFIIKFRKLSKRLFYLIALFLCFDNCILFFDSYNSFSIFYKKKILLLKGNFFYLVVFLLHI